VACARVQCSPFSAHHQARGWALCVRTERERRTLAENGCEERGHWTWPRNTGARTEQVSNLKFPPTSSAHRSASVSNAQCPHRPQQAHLESRLSAHLPVPAFSAHRPVPASCAAVLRRCSTKALNGGADSTRKDGFNFHLCTWYSPNSFEIGQKVLQLHRNQLWASFQRLNMHEVYCTTRWTSIVPTFLASMLRQG